MSDLNDDLVDDVLQARQLLALGVGLPRDQRAELFARAGVYFMKGPFREANFTRTEREYLPTNVELAAAARAIGVRDIYADRHPSDPRVLEFEREKMWSRVREDAITVLAIAAILAVAILAVQILR